MRPKPLAFMCGSAAWMAWKMPDRLMAMMASQRSAGKFSTLSVYWMPALFTRISTEPKLLTHSSTIAFTSAGFEMSAPL